MTNHPNRAKKNVPKALLEYNGGEFVVAYPRKQLFDGTFAPACKMSTGAAHPGCTAAWILGDGDRARRATIMETKHAPYTYARREEDMAKEFAKMLGAKIVDNVDEAAENFWGENEMEYK